MKKLLIAAFLAITAHAQVQQTLDQLGQSGNWVVAFRWTADGAGAVPVTAAKIQGCCQGYFVSQVEIVPGTPAPTAGYSIQINDSVGFDMLGGSGAGLSATIPASFATSGATTPLQGTFSLAITGQSVAGAKGAVYVFLSKPGILNQAKLGPIINTLGGGNGSNLVGFQQPASGSVLRTMQAKAQENVSPLDFGADPTGTRDSTIAIQAAMNYAVSLKACLAFNTGQFKITGSLLGPALGQLCTRGTYNAVPYTGNISGLPPRGASLIQQQNNAITLSLSGLSNVVDGLDLTVASGVTGVTAIYGTDTPSQPFAHNRITNNTIHGYSTGATQGMLLAKGIDIESIGANSNNNTITGNVVELATYGYYLNGLSSSAVVNANIFHNWAANNTHAAFLNNAGEMGEFWLSMEGNGDAVTAVGVCCSSFRLDNGEQAPPHLMLSGASHDNTLWGSTRSQNGGQIGMTVTSDSMVNNLTDLGSIWQGINSSGQRFWCFGCVKESSTSTPNLAIVQWNSDASGTRALWRIGNASNPNAVSDVSFFPNGNDGLGYPNYYFSTISTADYTIPVSTFNQGNGGGDTHSRSFSRWTNGRTSMGGFGGQYLNSGSSAVRGAFMRTYDGSGTEVDPLFARGDGGIQIAPSVQGTCSSANLAGAAGNDAGTLFTSGTFRYVQSGAGVQDHLYFCAKDAANAYAWRTIY